MPQTLQMLANAALIVRNKSERSQAKLTARENLAFQFALAEKYSLTNLHLAARPDQRLPSGGIDFTRQEDFDFPRKVFRFCCSRWRLRMHPGAPPEQARRNDARIVEDEEFVAAQQAGKFREDAVLENSWRPTQAQQPRRFATLKGTLRNLFSREMVVQLFQTHGKRQSSSKVAEASQTNKLVIAKAFGDRATQTRDRRVQDPICP